jgi:hypothetical protein
MMMGTQSIARLVAALVLASPVLAHADPAFPDHPFLSGSLGMGLTYTTSDASDTGQGSFFGRIDVQALAPIWLSLRTRVAPITEVDTLVGIRLSHHVGSEGETHYTEASETASTRTYNVSSEALLSRSDVVLVAGLKSTAVIMPAKDNGMPGETRTDPFSILAAGFQWQTATALGSHRTVELYALYNPSTSSSGATALWHNSLHNPLSSHLVFGMEVGYVPASSGTVFFWSLVDIGYAFEH